MHSKYSRRAEISRANNAFSTSCEICPLANLFSNQFLKLHTEVPRMYTEAILHLYQNRGKWITEFKVATR